MRRVFLMGLMAGMCMFQACAVQPAPSEVGVAPCGPPTLEPVKLATQVQEARSLPLSRLALDAGLSHMAVSTTGEVFALDSGGNIWRVGEDERKLGFSGALLPRAMGIGPDGTFYVADGETDRVFAWREGSGSTWFAGHGEAGEPGPAIDVDLKGLAALTVNDDGTVFAAANGQDQSRILRLEKGAATVVADHLAPGVERLDAVSKGRVASGIRTNDILWLSLWGAPVPAADLPQGQAKVGHPAVYAVDPHLYVYEVGQAPQAPALNRLAPDGQWESVVLSLTESAAQNGGYKLLCTVPPDYYTRQAAEQMLELAVTSQGHVAMRTNQRVILLPPAQ